MILKLFRKKKKSTKETTNINKQIVNEKDKNILKDLQKILLERKLLKENYSYDEFREILITENLVTIDKGTNNTIPTQYAIDNKYIIVRKYYEDKNKYLFYITQNGINKILKK